MTAKLYIHILFPAELRPNDIQVISPPTADQPGHARLIQAQAGAPRAEAPNSLPLKSRSGATVGYVANTKHIEEPYNDSYIIA